MKLKSLIENKATRKPLEQFDEFEREYVKLYRDLYDGTHKLRGQERKDRISKWSQENGPEKTEKAKRYASFIAARRQRKVRDMGDLSFKDYMDNVKKPKAFVGPKVDNTPPREFRVDGNTPDEREEKAYTLFRSYKNAKDKQGWIDTHTEKELQTIRAYNSFVRYRQMHKNEPISLDQYLATKYNPTRDKSKVPQSEREYMKLVNAYVKATKTGKIDQWKAQTSPEDQEKVFQFRKYLNAIAKGKIPKYYGFDKWSQQNTNEIRINKPSNSDISIKYNGDLPVNTVADLKEYMNQDQYEQIHTAEYNNGFYQGLTVNMFGHLIEPQAFKWTTEYAQINFIRGIGFEFEVFFGASQEGFQKVEEVAAQLTSIGWVFKTFPSNAAQIKIYPGENPGKSILYNGEKLI